MQVLYTILKSYSQVFLQDNWLLGALIIIGLAIASPIALLLSFVGLCSSVGTALLLEVPKHTIESGLYGFNAVLVGVAASVFIKSIPASILVTVIASIITALIFYAFSKNNMTALTLPFVLMGWGIILTAKYFK